MTRFRTYVQWGVFLLTLSIGFQFYIHVHQAVLAGGEVTVPRPPGVEGFLPIGALMAWKAFLTTGVWDRIHPAAMVILGFAALVSLFFRKSFCGWFCPVGTLSEGLFKLGAWVFRRNYRVPTWLDYPLRGLKYLLLGFFVYVVVTMPQSMVTEFLNGPYYKMADVKMLFFFTRMSLTAGIVLGVLVVSSLFTRNPWCRFFCPYGALMGLLAWVSPTRIERNEETCIHCDRCSKICPYHLPVAEKKQTRSPECNGCMACTQVCPVQDTLHLRTKGLKRYTWSPLSLGVFIIGLFILIVSTARITGHWESSVSEHEFQVRLMEIDGPAYTHPEMK